METAELADTMEPLLVMAAKDSSDGGRNPLKPSKHLFLVSGSRGTIHAALEENARLFKSTGIDAERVD